MADTKLILPAGVKTNEPEPEAAQEAKPLLECQTCIACGARRPKEEVAHKACSNCISLKMMEDELATRAEREEDAKKSVQRAGEDLKNLPDLDRAASCLYDDERGVVWVGFNLKDEKLDQFGLVMLMDQAKSAAVANFIKWKVTEQKRKSKIVRVVESVGGMMDRLRGKQTGKSPLLKP